MEMGDINRLIDLAVEKKLHYHHLATTSPEIRRREYHKDMANLMTLARQRLWEIQKKAEGAPELYD